MKHILLYVSRFKKNLESKLVPPKSDSSPNMINKAAIMASGFVLIAASAFGLAPTHEKNYNGSTKTATILQISIEIQRTDDQALVLQKCLDLQALKSIYVKDTKGSFKQLNVLQHGVSFPETIDVTFGGQKVEFINKAQLKSDKIDAYFYFHEFRIEGNIARIEYAYNYDQLTDSPKVQVISLQLEKTSQGWNIAQSKMEAR